MSVNYIDQITDTSGTTHYVAEGVDTRIFRATCSTAAATAEKVATLDDSTNFSLTAGVKVAVTFTYGNSAATPTLRVDGTTTGTAKTIVIPSSATGYTAGSGTSYNTWGPYETVLFTYTGTNWVHDATGYLGYLAYNTASGRQAKITASGILKGDGAGGVTAATAGTDYQAPLPSQSDNNGKYLTTNGSSLSWASVDALPSQSGNSGKYLTTNGTSASWTTVSIPTVPTMDSTPTNGNSSNTVSSDGVYDMVMGRTKVYTATCSTAAATTTKVATLDDATGFSLTAGVRVAVTFTYGNSATTPTLNVNSTGVKNICFPTAVNVSSSGGGSTYNTWGPYETVIFTYNSASGVWVNGGSSLSIYRAYKLADNPSIYTDTITTSTTWSGNGPYTQTVTLPHYTSTSNSFVSIQPDVTNIAQLIADGTSALYIGNNNGTLTLYAIGNHPTVAMTLQVTIEEVRATS